MFDGCSGYAIWGERWPAWLHECHARRRWEMAKFADCQAHPQLAEQEFRDIVDGKPSAHEGYTS